MTRLTSDERAAIEFEIQATRTEIERLYGEIVRLQSMLDVQPDGSDGDTLRLLRALCTCGLPLDHRHPMSGDGPRGCADATERIAFEDSRGKPPVPGSVTRDESVGGTR